MLMLLEKLTPVTGVSRLACGDSHPDGLMTGRDAHMGSAAAVGGAREPAEGWRARWAEW